MDSPRSVDPNSREAVHEAEVLVFGWILLFAWLGSILCMTREYFFEKRQKKLAEKLEVTRI
jgi:hypothetical protein